MDIRPVSAFSPPAPAQPQREVAAPAQKDAAAPLQTIGAVEKPDAAGHQHVEQAINNINKSLQTQSQGLEFSIDPDSDRTVVKVVDQETRQVLRQMPTAEALEIAKALDKTQGMLIHNEA